MRRLVTVVALAMLASLVVSQAAADQTPVQQLGITGTYRSNWDEVKLTQDGNRVLGTYVCCGGGTIEGKIVEGRTIHYVWRQPGSWGLGVWTIESGRLDGTWGTGQNTSSGGRWDLKLSKPTSQLAK